MEAETPVPTKLRFAPIEYFRQACMIVFWDDPSIRRASRDPNALLYGLLFSLLPGGVAILLFLAAAQLDSGDNVIFRRTILVLLALIPLGLAYDVIRYGICHLIAKYLLGGTGKFLPLLRALLLGCSVVSWTALVPFIGIYLAGIGSIVVIMVVFEELEHIERLQAFVLSAGVNIIFWGVIFYLQPVTHSFD
jgi:hypothetical protein